MITKEAVINNLEGLHARPAVFFIQKANEFKSSIWIEKDERRVNAKSLLGVLSLPSNPNNMKPKQGRVISTPLFS